MNEYSKPLNVIQELFNNGAIHAVKALPVPMSTTGGYHLFFYGRKGEKVAVLEAQRGDHRVFKTLDAAAALAYKIGLSDLSVMLR